ncbi:MAG: hypothetical protein GX442_07530 [Candidatus Riflebacteria bacterium]|nr:hypothetical protein [Candidatus Riflebacteria bacterium]
MIIIASLCLAPIVGTIDSGLGRTKSLELKSFMQNAAESKMNDLLNRGMVAGEAPVGSVKTLTYPSSDPQFTFIMRVEVVSSVIASGLGDINPAIEGLQHPDTKAVSIEIGQLATEPIVASVSLFSLFCPPPPPPDRLWACSPEKKKVYCLNPFTHDVIDQFSTTETPCHLAIHPSGKWAAVKCASKIMLLGIDPSSGNYGVFSLAYDAGATVVCGNLTTESAYNNTLLDRGIVFRSDGKYLYFTTHSGPSKIRILEVPPLLPGLFTFHADMPLNSDVSLKLVLLQDGNLAVAQDANTGPVIPLLNTFTHVSRDIQIGSTTQYAVGGSPDGLEMYARLSSNNLAAVWPDTPTIATAGTMAGNFSPGAVNAQADLVVTPDGKWILLPDSDTGGSPVGVNAIRLPLRANTLADTNYTWNTVGAKGDNNPITEIQLSPFRNEVIAKSGKYNVSAGNYGNRVHFASWRSLAAGAYVSTPIPNREYLFEISDFEGRLAEYAYIACSDGVTHTLQAIDIYGGDNGRAEANKTLTLARRPTGVAFTAGGDRAVVSYNDTGFPPANLDVFADSLATFSPTLVYPGNGKATQSAYLLDRSLLVLTEDTNCTCKFWGMPPGTVGVASHVNGFVLYEADTMGNLIAAPKLSLGLDYSAGWRVKDVVPTHRSAGAYVLWSNVNATGTVLAWIASSTEPGFNGGTSNFRVLGLWNGMYESFPEGRPTRMALSRDDTLLALYDPVGVGGRQIVRIYDLNNSKLPIQTGMNRIQYWEGTLGSTQDASNTYQAYPRPSTVPINMKQTITGNGPAWGAAFNEDWPAWCDDTVCATHSVYLCYSGFWNHPQIAGIGNRTTDAFRVGGAFGYLTNAAITGRTGGIHWRDEPGEALVKYNLTSEFTATGSTLLLLDLISADTAYNNRWGYKTTVNDQPTTGTRVGGDYEPPTMPVTSGETEPFKAVGRRDTKAFHSRPGLVGSITLWLASNGDRGKMTFYRDLYLPILIGVYPDDGGILQLRAEACFPTTLVWSGSKKLEAGGYSVGGVTASTEVQDVEVSPDGRRLLVVLDNPSKLVIFDVSGSLTAPYLDFGDNGGQLTKLNEINLPAGPREIAVRPFNSFRRNFDVWLPTPIVTTGGSTLGPGCGNNRAVMASSGIILAGGSHGASGVASPEVRLFEPLTNAVTALPDLGGAVSHPGVVAVNDEVLVLGGNDGAGNAFATVQATANGAWETRWPLQSDNNASNYPVSNQAAGLTPHGIGMAGGVTMGTGMLTIADNGNFAGLGLTTGGTVTVAAADIQFGAMGAVWLHPITIGANTSFIASFTTLTKEKDGLCFVVQTIGPNACGSNDRDMGYAGYQTSAVFDQNPGKSVAVWMDNHDNGSPWDHNSTPEVAIVKDGGGANAGALTLQYNLNINTSWYDDGTTARTNYWWVVYDGQRNTFDVWMNNSTTGGNNPEVATHVIKDCVFDISSMGTSAWFGFTGGQNGTLISVTDFSLSVWEPPALSNVFTRTNFSSWPGGFTVGGTPSMPTQAGSSVKLQSDGTGDRGGLWWGTGQTLSANTCFQASFSFHIAKTSATTHSAHGMTFAVRGDLNTLYGAYGQNSKGYEGIANSFAVPFDTINYSEGEVSNNWIGILKNGDLSPSYGIGVAEELDAGTPYYGWVEYLGPARLLRFYWGGSSAVKPTNPLFSFMFSSTLSSLVGATGYFGFTAEAGDSSSDGAGNHYVDSFRLDLGDIPVLSTQVLSNFKAYYPTAVASTTGGLPSNLIGHYRLDETTGATTALDSAGSRHGSINGIPTFVTGVSKNCVTLNGSNQWITINPSYDLTGGGFTAMAWVWLNSGSQKKIISKWDDNTGCKQFQIQVNASSFVSFEVMQANGTNVLANTSATFPTGQWVHLAAVADPSGPTLLIYRNGFPDTLSPDPSWDGTIKSETGNMDIGRKPNPADYWNGKIDDVQIYNRALSQTEIQRAMNGGTAFGETLDSTPLTHAAPTQPMRDGVLVNHFSRKAGKWYLYLVGGGTATTPGTQAGAMVYRYDFDNPGGGWVAQSMANFDGTVAAPEVTARTAVAACSWGEEIFIFGGLSNNGVQSYAIAYNPDTGKFRQLSAVPPPARCFSAAIPSGPFIYLFGGATSRNGLTDGINSIYRYKP